VGPVASGDIHCRYPVISIGTHRHGRDWHGMGRQAGKQRESLPSAIGPGLVLSFQMQGYV
jgi:hypothetical protein